MSETRTVRLVSQEGEQFDVSLEVAKMSELVRTMFNDDQNDVQEIALEDVKTHILAKVIKYAEHYQVDPMTEIAKPLKSANMSDVVQEWYATFIDVDQEILFELMLAARSMNIVPLYDLTCATLASMMKGKTPEEIRRYFNLVNDFTPEEEAQVREENKWCEEA